jgi:molybdenum cofactor cytidylyltransferase
MNETYGVIILAGGKSMRMNFPKIYLDAGGETFLQKITTEYFHSGIRNSCLVINEEYCGGVWKKNLDAVEPMLSEVEKTSGRLSRFHSVKLGVRNMTTYDFVFLQNADNPFVDRKIIEGLIRFRNPYGYSQVMCNGESGHPVLLSQKIVQHLNRMEDRDYNLREVLKEFPRSEVEVNDAGVLANINTIEDYEKYFFHHS